MLPGRTPGQGLHPVGEVLPGPGGLSGKGGIQAVVEVVEVVEVVGAGAGVVDMEGHVLQAETLGTLSWL